VDREDNIIDLAKYRQKGQSDIKAMLQIHDHILTIEDEQLKVKMREIWLRAAMVLIYEPQP
jgi:threonine dehydratase